MNYEMHYFGLTFKVLFIKVLQNNYCNIQYLEFMQ